MLVPLRVSLTLLFVCFCERIYEHRTLLVSSRHRSPPLTGRAVLWRAVTMTASCERMYCCFCFRLRFVLGSALAPQILCCYHLVVYCCPCVSYVYPARFWLRLVCARVITDYFFWCSFRVEDGSLASELKGHVDGVTAVLFDPNGKALYTCGDDCIYRIWQ